MAVAAPDTVNHMDKMATFQHPFDGGREDGNKEQEQTIQKE